jgi:two-component system sensor histidine kinase CpxA
MKSLFVRVLAWFAGMLVFSMLAFWLTSYMVRDTHRPMARMFHGAMMLQLDDAREAWEQGGAEALRRMLAKIDSYYPGTHRLVDGQGRDLLTGEHHEVRPPTPPRLRLPPFLFWMFGGRTGPPPEAMVTIAEDRRYALVTLRFESPQEPNLLPYFSWIVIVLIGLTWALTFTLVRPLRELRQTLQRFAGGDLSVRIRPSRRDEFGDVARSFDVMADRIETLLTAERRLLQDVSHELRSPLARMNFAIELAKSSEDRAASLARIKKESARLAELVHQLIEMTRAEGDPAVHDYEPLRLEELVETITGDCAIEAEAKGCAIEFARVELPVVQANRELLRRAVENVLRNAIRHTPEGTRVEVRLGREGGWAVISIRDQGAGVPDDQIDQIFRPFVRVEGDRSRESGGVGLGLAIAQRAIYLHGGSISAANASPGLDVSIRLPLNG